MAQLTILNKQYVSSLSSFLDQREINKQVTDIANDDMLSDILEVGNRKKVIETGQPFYSTFVNESVFKTLDTTGGSVTGTGTTQITFTTTAATSGIARKDDVILTPTGNVSGLIVSVVTASGIDTIIAKSVSGANFTVTAGNKYSIYSVAVGENSVSQQNIEYGLTRFFNKYQIFRERSVVTDVQNAATVEVSFNGQTYFQVKDHIEKLTLLKGHINGAFIGGDMSDTSFASTNAFLVDPNTSGTNGGGNVQTTRGLDKYNELYGTTLVDGTLGTYQKANLDNVVAVLIANRAPKDQLAMSGTITKTATDTYYKSLGSSGVNSVRMIVNGQELNMEVDKVTYGGFRFSYAVMPILDNQDMFKFSDISKSIYYVPMNGKVKVLGGGFDDAMQVRYIPAQTPSNNGLIGEMYGGALAWNGKPTFNGDVSNADTSWITAQGFEVNGAQFLVKQQVIA